MRNSHPQNPVYQSTAHLPLRGSHVYGQFFRHVRRHVIRHNHHEEIGEARNNGDDFQAQLPRSDG